MENEDEEGTTAKCDYRPPTPGARTVPFCVTINSHEAPSLFPRGESANERARGYERSFDAPRMTGLKLEGDQRSWQGETLLSRTHSMIGSAERRPTICSTRLAIGAMRAISLAVARNPVRRHAGQAPMNPDKLFDYLDGKLPDWERTKLENEMAEDPQLQKEFAAARRIHSNMRGEKREVLVQDDAARNAHGRKMAMRIGTAFVILMGVNVAAGLWFIAHREASNPNRPLLEQQMRDQLTRSLQASTHATLTPPPLGVSELTISVAAGQSGQVADQVVLTAQKLGGSATKELPDLGRVGVLVDLPGNREAEFRAALTSFSGSVVNASSSNDSATERKSFVVQVVENPAH